MQIFHLCLGALCYYSLAIIPFLSFSSLLLLSFSPFPVFSAVTSPSFSPLSIQGPYQPSILPNAPSLKNIIHQTLQHYIHLFPLISSFLCLNLQSKKKKIPLNMDTTIALKIDAIYLKFHIPSPVKLRLCFKATSSGEHDRELPVLQLGEKHHFSPSFSVSTSVSLACNIPSSLPPSKHLPSAHILGRTWCPAAAGSV